MTDTQTTLLWSAGLFVFVTVSIYTFLIGLTGVTIVSSLTAIALSIVPPNQEE